MDHQSVAALWSDVSDICSQELQKTSEQRCSSWPGVRKHVQQPPPRPTTTTHRPTAKLSFIAHKLHIDPAEEGVDQGIHWSTGLTSSFSLQDTDRNPAVFLRRRKLLPPGILRLRRLTRWCFTSTPSCSRRRSTANPSRSRVKPHF